MMSAEPLRLTVPLGENLLGVVTSFSEQAGLALGLGRTEAMKLTLAAEEVFSYLLRRSRPEESIRLEAASGGYYVELKLLFPSGRVDLSVFNLTADLSLDDEAGLEKLGLLIASRSVERFSILTDQEGGLGLSFRKEKKYPPPGEEPPPEVGPLGELKVVPPGPEQLKLLARLLAAHYQPNYYPSDFALPGKLVDMVGGGEFGALLATDEKERPGGCLLWRWLEGRTVLCFGPYLFNQPQGSPAAEALVEAALGRLAKTDAVSLICRYPTPELPVGHFELLGELEYVAEDGQRLKWPHFFRQLKEDPGTVVWAHPELEEFLRRTYDQLFLAREVRLTRPEGEERPAQSVLGVHLDRGQNLAMVVPLWDGRDAGENLGRHVELLLKEGFRNLYVNLDLGRAWQSYLVPDLLAQGFQPRLVMPYGGTSDQVIFQHGAEAA